MGVPPEHFCKNPFSSMQFNMAGRALSAICLYLGEIRPMEIDFSIPYPKPAVQLDSRYESL